MPATQSKLDLKKQFPDYYKAPRKPVEVTLPEARFVTMDGVGALYSIAYTLKFACKADGNDFTVPSLEAFWWAGQREVMVADPSAIKDVPREEWAWKAMIRVPDFVTESLFADGQQQAFEKKQLESVKSVKFEKIAEGRCVQMMHVGSYSTEPQTVKAMLDFMAETGLIHAERPVIGPHHEIYLSDPRRTAEEKLKTLIRIPVDRPV